MRCIRWTCLCLAVSLLFTASAFAQPADLSSADSRTAAGVLQSPEASTFEKAKACQRLAIIGDAASVAALAPLLADEQLSNYARHALESIPEPEADAALRDALPKLSGELLVGVLDSIGRRRDEQALMPMAELLDADDPSVASAAARSMAQVAAPRAIKTLLGAWMAADDASREPLAQALLILGQRLVEQDRPQEARSVLERLRADGIPDHLRQAATYSLILIGGDAGRELLIDELSSPDDARFQSAVQAARRLGANAADALTATLRATDDPGRQSILLLALGDVLSAESLRPVVSPYTEAGTAPPVRMAALNVLAREGDAASVPALITAALASDPQVARAGQAALVELADPAVDAAIVRLLEGDQAQERGLAIAVASRRPVPAAGPKLLALAQSSDGATRVAALEALGGTIRPDDFPKLVSLALALRDEQQRTAARQAAQLASFRLPQDAAAEAIIKALPGADAEGQAFLLEQLASVGGERALAAVASAARSSDDSRQDAATRVLGEWLSADAAPVLLELSRTLPAGRYQVRALRGYLRLARQLDMSTAERIDVCRNVLALTDRPDDRNLVLEVLRRYPTLDGLELAASLLDEPALRDNAGRTVIAIAQRFIESDAAAARSALDRVAKTASPAVAGEARAVLDSSGAPN